MFDKKYDAEELASVYKSVYEKKLDPVGQEDKDIDNDGDHDKSDKYLLNRRKVRGAAIKTRKEEVELDENRRAARSAGGYKDDSKKQTDPSKDGFTGISGSIKDIMRQNKEIEAREKKKTKKEEVEVVDENLQKAVDNLTKKAQGGLERMGVKINRTSRGTARPSAQTANTIRQNKATNEDFELWVHELLEEGYDLSDYTWDEMFDIYIEEGMKQARANVGAGKCWDGYTAKGTKKKNGKEVPNCVKEEEETTEAYDLTFSKPMKHVSTSPSGQKRYSTKDDGRHQRGVTPDGKPGGVNAPRTVGPGGAKIYNAIRSVKKKVFGDDYQPEGENISELSLPRSVTVIPPSGPKGDQRMYKAGGGDAAMSQKGQTRDQVIQQGRKNYVKQRGDAAKEDIKRQDAGKSSRIDGKFPEFRVQNNSYEPEGEMVEEGKKELSREKRNKMFRRAGNLSREALQGGDKGSEAHKKSGKIVKALNKDAEENNRNDVREETLRDIYEAKKKGLWDNIHAKRERGESPAKPGDEGYPKTLKVESLEEAAPALVGVLAKMAAKKAAVHVAKKSAEKVKDKMGKLLKGDEEEEEG